MKWCIAFFASYRASTTTLPASRVTRRQRYGPTINFIKTNSRCRIRTIWYFGARFYPWGAILVIWQIDAIKTLALSHHLTNMLLLSNEHEIAPLCSFLSSDFSKRRAFTSLSARIVPVPPTPLAFSLSSKSRDVNQFQTTVQRSANF